VHIAVIGAGYVGLVTGVSLADAGGHEVTLVERSPERFRELAAGRMPISEPGLAEAFSRTASSIRVVQHVHQIASPDLVFVCVGTPVGEDGQPDLTQLDSVMADLRVHKEWHVSVRSTLPPGISNRLPDLLHRTDSSRLSTNPEFLKQGSALRDYAHPDRIVIGQFEDTSEEHLRLVDQVISEIDAPRVRVSVAAAELIKNVANGFLALKLSFVNEVASLAEAYDVEVDEILSGIAPDPRIGSAYMGPGLGFGGSCLPKELEILAIAGRRRGLPMHVARAAAQVNQEQMDRFVARVLDEMPGAGARIGLLGLSFKAFTDDVRGSPAVYVARRLLREGHEVIAYDPAVSATMAGHAVPGIQLAMNEMGVFRGANAVVIATDWPQFQKVDLGKALRVVAQPLIFDGRNLLDPDSVVSAGFVYAGVGRRSRRPANAGR
jgi:UDPglucose 6-dehydrogenase